MPKGGECTIAGVNLSGVIEDRVTVGGLKKEEAPGAQLGLCMPGQNLVPSYGE